MSTFNDETEVTVVLKIDRGALAALKDNPLTLSEDEPGAYFGNAVRRGVQALGGAREIRDLLVIRPCHVTGMHTPDHHMKDPDGLCTLQQWQMLVVLMEKLGLEFKDLPRQDHEDCGWCEKYNKGFTERQKRD